MWEMTEETARVCVNNMDLMRCSRVTTDECENKIVGIIKCLGRKSHHILWRFINLITS